MKKAIVLGLAAAALASAGQALALTNELTGFYRAQFTMHNLTRGNDEDPDQFVTQRFRFKDTIGVNDYVKVVYFGEIDMEWGDRGSDTARNQGGGVNGDTVNLETKNLYIEAKLPGTPLAATIGLQGHFDNYDGALWSGDGAGLTVKIPTAKVDSEIGWFKWYEGATTGKSPDGNAIDFPGQARAEDDVDIYFGRVALKPVTGLKLGADLYYYKNQGGQTSGNNSAFPPFTNGYLGLAATEYLTLDRADLYYLGLNAGYATPLFGIKGWFFYNWGKLKGTAMDNHGTPANTADDTVVGDGELKVSGYAATVRADVNVAGFNTFVRGMYWSKAGDDPEKIHAPFVPSWQAPDGQPWGGDGILMLMLGDINYINGATNGYMPAANDAAGGGYGMWGVELGATYVPPAMKEFYTKAAVGHFRTLTAEDGYWGSRGGKVIGTELAARVGYKLCGGALDLSLNGAYAWLGSFYNNTVDSKTGARFAQATPGGAGWDRSLTKDGKAGGAGAQSPDASYRLYVQAQVPF